MLDNDSKIILETIERTKQMVEKDTQTVEKSFKAELEENLKRTEPDWFFKVLFLSLLVLSITGYLRVPLFAFVIIYFVPAFISLLAVSVKKFSEFIDRKLFERAIKLEKKHLGSPMMSPMKSPKEEFLEGFEEDCSCDGCGCCHHTDFED